MDSTLSINLGGKGRLEWNPKDKESLLGEGAFGSVYRGSLDYNDVAIKVIKKANRNGTTEKSPGEAAATSQHGRELRRLQKLRPHPCIVQFLGAAQDPISQETLIVTELLTGGSLHDALTVMRSHGTPADGGAVLEEKSFLRVGLNIASGLLHLHSEQVTHGDMKPHNVLLNTRVEIMDEGTRACFRRDVRAKLADFGLSRRTSDLLETVNTSEFGPGPVGTFAYMAPEAFDGIAGRDGSVAKAADVFAIAVVMYELLCGRQPWIAENVRSVWTLCRLVCTDKKRPSWGPRRKNIRPEYIEFVERCWAQNYEDRPTSSQVAKQFRNWEVAFKARKSASDGPQTPESAPQVSENDSLASNAVSQVTMSKGTESDTPSSPDEVSAVPSPSKESVSQGQNEGKQDNLDDSLNLGYDGDGNPYMRRVVTTQLDEQETLHAVQNFVHSAKSAEDIGASTDTGLDDTNASNAELGVQEPIEYEYGPVVMEDYSVTESSLSDFTIEFGQKVKRVQSQAIQAPSVPGIEIGLLSDVPKFEPPANPSTGEKKSSISSFESFVNAVDRVNKANDGVSEPAPKVVKDSVPEITLPTLTLPGNNGSNNQSPVKQEPPPYAPPVLHQVINASPPQQPPLGPSQRPQLSTGAYPPPPHYSAGQVWNIMTASPQQAPVMAPPHSIGLTTSVVPGHQLPQFNIHIALSIIQGPNPRQALDLYWNAAGHAHVIAQAFVYGSTQSPPLLTGKLYLDLALEYINRNNSVGPKLPMIARDLCLTVGSLASSSGAHIDKSTAQQALPIALRAIQSFHNDAAVYSACCFAMANILHISNHIETAERRKDVAVWIVHAISWNTREKKLASLAYTATCAARNFIWLNEANAEAFLSKTSLFNAPPLYKLLVSMREFRNDESVLDASLSALGMVAYFPRMRPEFVNLGGITVMVDLLRQSLRRAQAASMCLSVLACVASEPAAMRDNERTALRSALLTNDACGAVVHALHFSLSQQQQQGRGGASLRLTDESLATIVALCEFDAEIRSTLVDKNAVAYLCEAVRGFAVTHVTLIHSALRTNCAVQMCEATSALAKSTVGLKRLQDAKMLRYVKNIKTLFPRDPRVVESASKAIASLA